ncbi:hypothetical protein QAD02_003369 [Eretmocerus hayati]|uniref:Uncharacterized protein n=1 Tax=Eretmocerus hayati TaxID=131215 RepID=A0ACC2NLP2_9HYME|nr:hypothetical protein QAD02_003369 [Eretmocerus hayati]
MTPARSDSFDYAQAKLDASTVSSFGASPQNASRPALPQMNPARYTSNQVPLLGGPNQHISYSGWPMYPNSVGLGLPAHLAMRAPPSLPWGGIPKIPSGPPIPHAWGMPLMSAPVVFPGPALSASATPATGHRRRRGHRGGSRVTRSLANTEASIELPEAASRPADVIAPPADFVPPASFYSFLRHVSATDTVEAAVVNTAASAGNSSSLHVRPATIPIDSAISPEIIVEPLALPGHFSSSEHVEGPFCLCDCQDSSDPSLETYATGLSVSLPSNAPSPVESRPISPAPPSYEEVVATSNPQCSNELAVPQPGNSQSLITIVSFYRLRNAADGFSRVLSEVLGAEQNSENLPDIVDISFGLHGVRHAEGAIDLPDLLSTLSRMSHSLPAIRDVAIAPQNIDSTSGSSVEILSNPSDSSSPDSNAPTADFLASAPENIDPLPPPDHDEAEPPDVVDQSEGAMQNGAA